MLKKRKEREFDGTGTTHTDEGGAQQPRVMQDAAGILGELHSLVTQGVPPLPLVIASVEEGGGATSGYHVGGAPHHHHHHQQQLFSAGGGGHEGAAVGSNLGDEDLSYEGDLNRTKFIMKNGCCRECMKAFSKTGKVSAVAVS